MRPHGWRLTENICFLFFSCHLFVSGVVISPCLSIPKTTYTLVGDPYLLPFIMHWSAPRAETTLRSLHLLYMPCGYNTDMPCFRFIRSHSRCQCFIFTSIDQPTHTGKTFWQLLTILYVLSWQPGVADLFSCVLSRSVLQFHIDAGPDSNANWWFLVRMCINLTLCILGNQSIQIQFEWWSSHPGLSSDPGWRTGSVSLSAEEPELSVISLSLLHFLFNASLLFPGRYYSATTLPWQFASRD